METITALARTLEQGPGQGLRVKDQDQGVKDKDLTLKDQDKDLATAQ